ncbi:MAG TPA: GNAT family N-acetyltransferase [Afifellaceae bacterium]|nr:GNAT family N-acetyltransferase [Afifellaceae bacterium]
MKTDAISLRDAAPDDFAAITAIYADAVLTGTASYELDPPDEAEMIRRWTALAEAGFPYIVAEGEGRLLGYAYAGPFRTRPAYRWFVEDTVYIARDVRRRGVGRMLLARLIARCEGHGFRQMLAVIGDGERQAGSIGLHAALGFRTVGTLEGSGFKFGRWLDTVLMQRPLGPGRTTLPEDR